MIRKAFIMQVNPNQQLFAYAEVADEAQWASIAEEEICKKWWTHMKPLMSSNPDDSPMVKDVREVFHIE